MRDFLLSAVRRFLLGNQSATTLLDLGCVNSLWEPVLPPGEAADHIDRFYRNYHSSRYVRDDLVIRLKNRLRDEDVERLEDEFRVLIKRGGFSQRGPYDVEDENLDLPRLAFTHTRYKY